MLIVISPAKKLDMAPVDHVTPSRPAFAEQAHQLVQAASELDVDGLRKLMKISESLARINADRYAQFALLPEKPAIFSFAGDTYQGLEASSLEPDELNWAQNRVRILSGLYGVLRPLDAIRPYRLEMGSRLQTARGRSLYEFWGPQLSRTLNLHADAAGTDVLINCASQEYFRAVDPKALKLRVVTPSFYETTNGTRKMVSFYAKRARGAMARFIIERRLTDVEGLYDFDLGGYRYDPDLSSEDNPVFVR